MDTSTLSCPACGASVPILRETTSHCLYCQTEVEVPPQMRGQIKDFRGGYSDFLEKFRFAHSLSIGIFDGDYKTPLLACYLLLGMQLPFLIWWGYFYSHSATAMGPDGRWASLEAVSTYLAFPAVLFSWSFASQMAKSFRRAAKAPRVSINIGQSFELHCPNCGSQIETVHSVVQWCRHCSSDALMPPIILSGFRRLWAKHVVSQRQKVEAENDVRLGWIPWVFIGLVVIAGAWVLWGLIFVTSSSFLEHPNVFFPLGLAAPLLLTISGSITLIVIAGTEEVGGILIRLLVLSPIILGPLLVCVGLFLEQAGIKI